MEFLYAIYTLKGSTDKDIQKAVDIISEIRTSYPNIEILSDENKKKVLSVLNIKYNADFNYSDMWTSRTTAYNQYNYFKSHIMAFNDVLSNESNSNKLVKKANANDVIDNLLLLDNSFETMTLEDIAKNYTNEI